MSRSIVNTRRSVTRFGVLAGSLMVVVGCTVKPAQDAGGANPILGGGVSDEMDALAIVDPAVYGKVDDCVDSAKLKIYTGDAGWQQTWSDVGETDFGLRTHCEGLASKDPTTFEAIHTDWVAWEAFVAAQSAVPTPTAPPPVPETVAVVVTPPPVLSDPSGCHPSYTPCVPIAADVDCAGPGNGPEYVDGPIQVIGFDEYRLDDGDGIACEPK